MTHYVPAFAEPANGDLVLGACRSVVPLQSHSCEPECVLCQDYLAGRSSKPHYTDPAMAQVEAEERADHMAAVVRGARIRSIAEAVTSRLHGEGQLRCAPSHFERTLRWALAEVMHPGVSVDV